MSTFDELSDQAENAIKQWKTKLMHSTAMERFYIPTKV